MDSTTSTRSGAAPSGPAFREETVEEAFRRYDVDNSGFLDFGEVSIALADMGALEGVLASKAGELFDSFDVDGDGQVDLDEFEVLVEKVKALRGASPPRPPPRSRRASPSPPPRFLSAKVSRRSPRSAKARARASPWNTSTAATGRSLSKIAGSSGCRQSPPPPTSSSPAPLDRLASASFTGRTAVSSTLSLLLAEHRVTFGQVAQRVSQCAPSERNLQTSAAAGSSERAAAAAARAAAGSANGPTPENVTTAAALRSIFSQYSSGLGARATRGASRSVGSRFAPRRVPDACQSAVTAAISSTAEDGGAPEGTVSFEAFAAWAKLASSRAKGNYRPPDDVHLQLDQRRALRESYEKFAGSKHGMKPDAWEATMRACGLISAKCADACAAVIFAKCKTGAGVAFARAEGDVL